MKAVKVSWWKDPKTGEENRNSPFPIELTERNGQSWLLSRDEADQLIVDLTRLVKGW